jgi:7,8-dihydropterin-6-yl-methyl-4-(beta-D-ribofuranosyl)aminobenzene 5'-phosphate synthase
MGSRLTDMRYAALYALAGLVRPFETAAFLRDRRRFQREFAEDMVSELTDLGTAKTLSVLPLVELYPAGPGLAGEPGVSYLVTIDGRTILFDVGLNAKQEHPSPLLRNMAALGFSLSDVDAVVISHIHLDHVGGRNAQYQKTFRMSKEPMDLTAIPAYLPERGSHPSAAVEVVEAPHKLAEGVASTGPLWSALWLMGPVAEQALIVNLEGKGIVLIVGCGHPSVGRIVERARAVADAPLYGIVGGLHFPVTGSRVGKGGQTILGNGKLPWQRINRRDVGRAIDRLSALDLRLIALSAHDSCDWTLDLFEKTFGDTYRKVEVGREIRVE